MSSTPSTDYLGTNPIDRIDSGETDESPFTSNLVTPTDEGYTANGILERLDSAKSLLGYFVSRSISKDGLQIDSLKTQNLDVIREPSLKESPKGMHITADSETSSKAEDCVVEEEQSLSPKSDVMATLPSAISSLSSSDSILRPITGAFYNLPNDHISVDKEVERYEENQISKQAENYSQSPDITTAAHGTPSSLTNALADSMLDLLGLSLRILFFIPWCVAVGGALTLAPSSLEKLAFGTGYIEPLNGIRRYSHWATYGFQHIAAFFAFTGTIVWFFPTLGYLILGGQLAQFCFEWHGFLEDTTIPLGEDDRQTIYLLATTTWMDHDKSVNIKKIDDDYYSTKDPMPDVIELGERMSEESHSID